MQSAPILGGLRPPALLPRGARLSPPLLERASRLSGPSPYLLARRHRTAAAAAAGAELDATGGGSGGPSALQQLLASGKVNKTALGKLGVAALREECELAGLSADGTKPVLVERLLAWAAAQQQREASGEQADGVAAAVAAAAEEEGAELLQQLAEVLDGAVPEAGSAAEALSVPAVGAEPTPQAPASEAAEAAGGGPPQQQAAALHAADAASGGRSSPAAAPPAADVARITFLGTSSGNPTSRRNVSCIAVKLGQDLCLVDAGEGSRNQLRRSGLEAGHVSHIFITHLHGDHCFGVCGMLAEICQARLGTPRQHEPIMVYGPPELQSLIAGTLRMTPLMLTTPVVVQGWVLDPARAHAPRAVDRDGLLQMGLVAPDHAAQLPPEAAAQWQDDYDLGSDQVVRRGLTWSVGLPSGLRVTVAQLQHRIPCWGYVFQEPHRLLQPPPAAAAAAGAAAGAVGAGDSSAAAEGGAQPAAQQAQQQQWAQRGRKLVVLGDTCDSRAIAEAARGCDVISHEATFMRGMEHKATVATHSTSDQAGAFARAVGAKALVLTHFSARYDSVQASRGARADRAQGRQRGGGRPQRGPASSAQGEEDLDEGELQRLVREAQSTFRSRQVFLASDYFTYKVHPHPPVPLPPGATLADLDRLAAEEAQARAQASGSDSEWEEDEGGREDQRRQQQQQARAPYAPGQRQQERQQRAAEGQRWQGPPRRRPHQQERQQQGGARWGQQERGRNEGGRGFGGSGKGFGGGGRGFGNGGGGRLQFQQTRHGAGAPGQQAQRRQSGGEERP